MKRKYILLILLLGCFFLIFSLFDEEREIKKKATEERGMFISYIELSNYLSGKSSEDGKRIIYSMVSNVDELGFNSILLQVRTFSDAIYPSLIFPWSKTISGKEGVSCGYDILGTFLNAYMPGLILIVFGEIVILVIFLIVIQLFNI